MSHRPEAGKDVTVPPAGLEPATSGLEDRSTGNIHQSTLTCTGVVKTAC